MSLWRSVYYARRPSPNASSQAAPDLFLRAPVFTKPIIKNHPPQSLPATLPVQEKVTKKRKVKAILAWTGTLGYAGLIFYLSSESHPAPFLGPLEKYHIDFLIHGVEYALFGILLSNSLGISFPKSPRQILFWAAVILGALYGASDEWHQSFVPMRDSSAVDWLADTIGVILGSYFYARNQSL